MPDGSNVDPSQTAAAIGAQPPASIAAQGINSNPASFFKYVEKEQAKKDAATAPIYAQMEQQYQTDKLRFDQVAQNYTPYKPTPPPQQPDTDPLRGFGSAAGVFAMIASGFSHTPAIAAMNGMAGAINATKQGDWESYQAHYKAWKDNTEQMIQAHKLQSEDMQEALTLMQTNLSAGVARAKAIAAQTDDHIQLATLERGEYDKTAEIQIARGNLALAAQRNAVEVERMQAEMGPLLPASMALTRANNDLAKAQATKDPAKIAAAQAQVDAAKSGWLDAQRQVTEAKQTNYGKMVGNNLLGGALQEWHDNYVAQYHREPTEAEKFAEYQKLQQKPAASASGAAERDANTLATAKFRDMNGGRDPVPGNQADEAQMAKLRVDMREDAKGLISDDAANYEAGLFAKGIITTFLTRSEASQSKIMDALAKINAPPEQIAQARVRMAGMMAAEKALATREVNIALPAEEVEGMGDIALALNDKIDRTQYPSLNSVLLAAAQGSGDPTVVKFSQAINSLAYTYAKFLNPSKSPTNDDLDHARELISKNWASGQIVAGISQMKQEIGVGKRAIKTVEQGVMDRIGGNTSAPAAGNIPVISDKAAYDALPSGSRYRMPGDPVGKSRRKP